MSSVSDSYISSEYRTCNRKRSNSREKWIGSSFQPQRKVDLFMANGKSSVTRKAINKTSAVLLITTCSITGELTRCDCKRDLLLLRFIAQDKRLAWECSEPARASYLTQWAVLFFCCYQFIDSFTWMVNCAPDWRCSPRCNQWWPTNHVEEMVPVHFSFFFRV